MKEDGILKAGSGWTEIFIYPGYHFKMIDSLIDIDVKYTSCFIQCTGRGALTDDQTGVLMVHMLSNVFYSGLFETIRHDLSRQEAIVYALRLGCSPARI